MEPFQLLLVHNKIFSFFQANRSSIPFHHPVNTSDVPNYYEVVKEPMGKFKDSDYRWHCSRVHI